MSPLGKRLSYPIRSYHGDLFGCLKPQFVLSFLEDSAWQNAEELGFGFAALKERELFWALTRLSVELSRWPRWGEEIEVETEPLGVSGPYAVRRFAGFVKSEQCFEANSAWAVIDGEKRRPQRPTTVFSAKDLQRFPGFSPKQVPAKIDEKGAETTHDVETRDVAVTYSELDVNNHVNNAEFLRWTFSILPYSTLEERSIRQIEINFVAELGRGDVMTLKRTSGDDAALVVGQSGNHTIFRCRIGFGT